MPNVFLLKVNTDGEPVVGDGVITLPAAPPGGSYILQLQIPAASHVCNGGIIWTNVPPLGQEFSRSTFYRKPVAFAVEDARVDIPIHQAGAYCYYASHVQDGAVKTTRKFHFVVTPHLLVNGTPTSLNSLAIQSVVSKWMGPRDGWDKLFRYIAYKGYNMIHFTPLQHRGESNSPYSIFDQLEFDPELFSSSEDVEKLVRVNETRHGLLSLTDVVLNHTANNSEWLRHHPEAGYSRHTAPHLTPAVELDDGLLDFSVNMKRLGYPTELSGTADLLRVMEGIKMHVLGALRLWEFYVVNVADTVAELAELWKDSEKLTELERQLPEVPKGEGLPGVAQFLQSVAAEKPWGLSARFGKKINTQSFARILLSLHPECKNDWNVAQHEATRILDELNLPLYKEYDDDVAEILEQLYNRIKYTRLDSHGPRLGPITPSAPLTEPYFSRIQTADGIVALANNGWIWNGNPLVDFASDASKAYLRREVISWGDCVKLRYGSRPEDSPYLWQRMTDYVRLCAKIFHGFRIDNCHSTPVHVGEYLLDEARKVRPDLYVVAELFTGSEQMDRLFVERLGISSLIREAMQAWSVEELSRLVHRHGGRPIGSLKWLPFDDVAYRTSAVPQDGPVAVAEPPELGVPQLVTAQPVHALFMDCTHDNETPNQKRTVEDTLPNAALVSMCDCAVGSVFGYDECYPELLDVVKEKRRYGYAEVDEEAEAEEGTTKGSASASASGIAALKRRLYAVRATFAAHHCEMHVHHEGQYITVHRVNEADGDGFMLIARTKFSPEGDQRLSPIYLHGTTAEPQFAYAIERVDATSATSATDSDTISGIPVRIITLEPAAIYYDAEKNETTVNLPQNFPQGSVAVLRTHTRHVHAELEPFLRSGAVAAAAKLTASEVNTLLYRCDAEERDASAGADGVYVVPNFGNLVYAGLQGWVSVLRDVARLNQLGHPICEHLRQGKWALDYVARRLAKYDSAGVAEVAQWLRERSEAVAKVPFFLVPKYFVLVIGTAYEAVRLRGLQLLAPQIQQANLFVQSLALVSYQMVAPLASAPLRPRIEERAPEAREVAEAENANAIEPAMAAGLPHFAVGYMRCWGRDVFISFRGLLLATGRHEDARRHLLGFAATLKHGLIPNLLDGGRNPRYNARDAAWFFLEALQAYCRHVPGGEAILDESVARRFPLDDRWVPTDSPDAFKHVSTMREIAYEILSRHARGISFREANAGPNLDSQMKPEGFDVSVHVDWSNGLVFGGSQYNCGTWMDKMGESERAGSKGVPGTPRDGAAVEINGLLKSALRWVNQLRRRGLFPWHNVITQDGKEVQLEEWEALVQENFEKCFYVPLDPSEDSQYHVDPTVVNRRGIYKDLFRSGKPYEDYQLRPNFAVAMVVAPELFNVAHAVKAIQTADAVLRGPLGMRTLDPSDLNYRPYYNNAEDSDDFATSKGRNYHQGPEWVWCTGYFLRAFLLFHGLQEQGLSGGAVPGRYSVDLLHGVAQRLESHRECIRSSVWAGLPELTNKDGAFCADSCPTQAWSAACLLDLFYDTVQNLGQGERKDGGVEVGK